MSAKKSVILWSLSAILTIAAVFYQRITGPTYPKSFSANVDGKVYYFKLPTSNDGDFEKEIKLKIPDREISAKIIYKRYKSFDEWTEASFVRQGDFLTFKIPHQPAAGKVMYKIELKKGDKVVFALDKPVVIRYRDPVPVLVVVFHLLFMFLTFALSIRTGFEAFYRGDKTYKLALATLVSLAIGGFIFGPLMQKYAFGAFWTGWPFGGDLTDNKTAFAFIFWLAAVLRLRKNRNRRLAPIIASIALLVVYLVPHSLLGSEIDYTKTENKIEVKAK